MTNHKYGLPKIFRRDHLGHGYTAAVIDYREKKTIQEALQPIVGRYIEFVTEIHIEDYGIHEDDQEDSNGRFIKIELSGGYFMIISASGTLREPFEDLQEALTDRHFSNLVIRTWEHQPANAQGDFVTNYFATIQMSDAPPFDFSIAGEYDEYYGQPPYISVKRMLSRAEIQQEAKEKFLTEVGPWARLAKAMITENGSFFYWQSPYSSTSTLHGGVFSAPTLEQLRYATQSNRKNNRGQVSTYSAMELRLAGWKKTRLGESPVFSLARYDPRKPLSEKERLSESEILDVCDEAFAFRYCQVLLLYSAP